MTLSGLICGTSALPREEEEDCEHERKTRSADSSPRKSRSKSGHGHGHGHNNPYSDRGLDRFSALLSEIEEKRQKIYSQVDDPNEISLVRFVYKAEDHEFKPIIVKAKPPPNIDQQQPSNNKKQPPPPQKTVPSRKFSSFSSTSSPSMATKEVKPEITTTTKNTRVKWEYYYYPKIYLTMIVIMIMVFLLVFGKSFAIMCTSIGWYVIPHAMSTTTTNSSRSSSKSKELVRAKLNAEKKQNKVVVLEGTKSFKHPRERVFGCQRTTS